MDADAVEGTTRTQSRAATALARTQATRRTGFSRGAGDVDRSTTGRFWGYAGHSPATSATGERAVLAHTLLHPHVQHDRTDQPAREPRAEQPGEGVRGVQVTGRPDGRHQDQRE